jgi:isopentenyl-diphosphate delta-isomerase type 1
MTCNAADMLVLVDEHDNQIGLAEKMQAHQLGLLHRAFSVFLLRKVSDHFEVLLQQRQADKYHCGGLWTNTCCSHPRANENIIAAGQRRLLEEMNIRADLQPIGAFIYRAEFNNGLIEYEYDHVLIGKFADDVVNFNRSEVQDYRWIQLSELSEQLRQQPELFTPWLGKALEIVNQNLELLNF